MKNCLYLSIVFAFISLLCYAQDDISLNDQLIIAAYDGDSVKVQTLLQRGAEANAVTPDEVTPLMLAAQNGHTSVVKMLMKNKAKPDYKSFDGNTALILAIKMGHIETAEYLIRNGADINLADQGKMTPLMHAVMVDSFFLPDMLIYYGARVYEQDAEGKNALMMASELGSYEIAVSLIDSGTDLNTVDSEQNTALHYATARGKTDIMELLILNGAEVDMKNEAGYTPLAVAVETNNYDAALMLVGYGADVNSRISSAVNILSLAEKNKMNSMITLLLNHEAQKIQKPNFSKFVTGPVYSFNNDDSRAGLNFGITDTRYFWMPQISYSFRPRAGRVFESGDEAVSYQYWERRHYLAVSADKAFLPHTFESGIVLGGYAGLGGVVTFGGYKGSSDHPDTRMCINPKIGILLVLETVRLKFSYEYLDLKLKYFDNFWFGASLEFLLDRKAGRNNISL